MIEVDASNGSTPSLRIAEGQRRDFRQWIITSNGMNHLLKKFSRVSRGQCENQPPPFIVEMPWRATRRKPKTPGTDTTEDVMNLQSVKEPTKREEEKRERKRKERGREKREEEKRREGEASEKEKERSTRRKERRRKRRRKAREKRKSKKMNGRVTKLDARRRKPPRQKSTGGSWLRGVPSYRGIIQEMSCQPGPNLDLMGPSSSEERVSQAPAPQRLRQPNDEERTLLSFFLCLQPWEYHIRDRSLF